MSSESESSNNDNEIEILNPDDINDINEDNESPQSSDSNEDNSDDSNNDNTAPPGQISTPDNTQVEKKTSNVWQHFDSEENYSICKYCKQTYAKSTSTSILKRHYRKNHEKKINKTKQTTLQFFTSIPHPEEIMHEKTISVVEWIVLDLQPFSVVASKSFIKLVNKLDPQY